MYAFTFMGFMPDIKCTNVNLNCNCLEMNWEYANVEQYKCIGC